MNSSNGHIPWVKANQNKSGNWCYDVCGSNGKVLFTSQTYNSKSNCRKAMKRFVSSIVHRSIYIKE